MSERELREVKLTKPWMGALRRYAPIVLVYLLATSLTDAYFMADTADYVASIMAHERGVYYDYWEFGHLFWRPLGWLVFRGMSLLAQPASEAEARVQIVWALLALNWLAGLLCVLSLRSLLGIVTKREWVANLTVVAFIFSHGFLNFAQTGSSYVPGLALTLLGLRILAGGGERRDSSWRVAVLGGAALAVAVCFWFLYLWAVPAALALPLFLFEADAERKRLVWRAALVFAVVSGLAYAAVLVNLGIHDVAGIRAWVASASHGNDSRGALRMVFGLSRSFIHMGNDGVLFKRFLLHDAFNPVSMIDLLRLSLWKVGLFYGFLCALFFSLLRSATGRRVLLLLLVNMIPVLGFAVLFDGGAVERYLPLYPLLFLSLGYVLSEAQTRRWPKAVALLFVAVVCATSIGVMAKFTLNRYQETIVARIKDLQFSLKPHSLVYAASWTDELVNFNRSFPLHPLNRQGGLVIGALVTPGTVQNEHWRQEFAANTLKAWESEGEVWVTKRVMLPRPRPDWTWVEGDDPRVSWPDFSAFFSSLKFGQVVGSDDGFMLLTPSDENKRLLESFARGEQKQSSVVEKSS